MLIPPFSVLTTVPGTWWCHSKCFLNGSLKWKLKGLGVRPHSVTDLLCHLEQMFSSVKQFTACTTVLCARFSLVLPATQEQMSAVCYPHPVDEKTKDSEVKYWVQVHMVLKSRYSDASVSRPIMRRC